VSDNFVGFAQSPKPDPKRNITKFREEIDLQVSERDLLAGFAAEATYSQIIAPVSKFDFHPGGKLLFAAQPEFRGTFSQISIPKVIVLNTELHGEIRFLFSAGKTRSRVVVEVQKALLSEEAALWQQSCESVVESIRGVFGGD
jgi:hypothetical protein